MRRALAACCIFLLPVAARAQKRDPAGATELFERGRAAIKQQDFATACSDFGESQRLDPKVGTLLNLADCEEHLGRLVSARAHWQEAVDMARSVGDAREAFAQKRLVALDPRVAKLTVRLAPSAPSSTVVRRDDVALGPASLGVELPVDPGDHLVVASAPGCQDATSTTRLSEGQVAQIVVTLDCATQAAPVTSPASKTSPAPKEEAPPPPPSTWSTQKTLAVAALGVGVAGVAVGSVFGLMAKTALHDSNLSSTTTGCDATNACGAQGLGSRDDAKRDATISTIAFAVGAAGLVGGAVLWLTAPKRSSLATAGVHLWASPQAAGVAGTF